MSGWELLAARPGGSVAAIATARASDGTALAFAATAAGVRRSADGGRSWTSLAAGGLTPPIEAVAASPDFARDRTIFVGTAAGLPRSTDGGASWQHVLADARVQALALSPRYADDHLLFAGTETDGILRSEDGGRTWTSANPGLLDLTVLALALSPCFATDRGGFAATASGLYRTRNGGKSWREVELPPGETAVQCLAVSPAFADDRLVLAGTEADGLLRSDDGGASWELVPAFVGRGVTAIAFSSRDAAGSRVAVATTEGILLSDDGGASWVPMGNAPGPALCLAYVSLGDDEVLLAGLPKRGVARYQAAQGGWQPANEGLAGCLLIGLTLSPSFADDQTLFVAGLEDGVAVSTDGGASWTTRDAGLEDAAIFDLAASPRYAFDRTLYAATSAGVARSRDGAATWQSVGTGEPRAPAALVATGSGAGDGPAAVVAALRDGRLLASDDGGERWHSLTPLPEAGEVLSLVLAPGYPCDRTIFVGTARPLGEAAGSAGPAHELVLWRSTDERWRRWLVERGPKALPVALPPDDPSAETLLVGVGGRLLRPLGRAQEVRGGERRPIWRGAALPTPTGPITAVSVSPVYRRDGTVFAASGGVDVSRDGGATFAPWSDGLAPIPIVALAVSPDYARDRGVYALGLGGTIWRRHDD